MAPIEISTNDPNTICVELFQVTFTHYRLK